MRLNEKVVVVTGASSGLGKAMAGAFVDEGARVACVARTADRLEATVDEIATEPGEATAIPADVRSWEDVQTMIETTNDVYGEIDVFVNNAALRQWTATGEVPDPIHDIPVDVWDAVLETNLRGYFLCAKAVLPEMLAREGGRLLHLSSGYGRTARPNCGAYSTSKFGVEGLCGTLELELQETGVDSVVLYPPSGGISTEYLVEHGSDPDAFEHADPGVIAEPAVQLAAGRGEHGGWYMGTPEGDGFVEHPRPG